MNQNRLEVSPISRMEKLNFFSPVRGMVTNSFNPLNNHFGTDIVAGPNEVVKATLDGTVTMASWTLETGHVIQNSGELTTGPHLHFELWQNGVPLNPEDYVIF